MELEDLVQTAGNAGNLKQIRIAPVTELADSRVASRCSFGVGYSDGELIPKRVFIVAQRIGGQVLGATTGIRLVGFAMRFPAIARASRTCTRTCLPCWRSIATRGWDGG